MKYKYSVNGHTTLNAPGLVSSPKSKQRRVPLVPGWVTAWEYGMLLAFFIFTLTEVRRFENKRALVAYERGRRSRRPVVRWSSWRPGGVVLRYERGRLSRRPVARVRFKTSNGRKRGMRGIGTAEAVGLVCFTTTATTQSHMGVYMRVNRVVLNQAGVYEDEVRVINTRCRYIYISVIGLT